MKVGNLLLECVCMCPDDDVRSCRCRESRTISYSCVQADYKAQICKYLMFKKSRAAIAVTDPHGTVVARNEYFGGFKLSDEDYQKAEKEWIEGCADYINKL